MNQTSSNQSNHLNKQGKGHAFKLPSLWKLAVILLMVGALALAANGAVQAALYDLAVTKTVSDTTPDTGQNITYTITATNTDTTNSLTNVVIRDLLPAGVTYVSSVPAAGAGYDPVTGLWTIGTIGTGKNNKKTLTITATVNAGTAGQTIKNTASVYAMTESDSVPGNNSADASVTVNGADLRVTKTANPNTANVGQELTYTVTVTNATTANGGSQATNVVIRDLLPAGVTYVSHTAVGTTYVPGTGLWTVGTLPAGANRTLTIKVTVNANTAAQTITNTASVISVDQPDPDSTNNTASAPVTVNGADLQVTKTVNNPTPKVGETVTFTVAVKNNGPENAQFSLTDLLPAGLTFVSATPSAGTYTSGTGVWSYTNNLNSAATATLTINAKVNSGTIGTTITNTATITSANKGDSITANNTSSASVKIESSDLALTKTVDKSAANQGETVKFTVTLTNNGPDAASGVVINDPLPAGLVYVSAAPSQGTYNGTTGVWSAGALPNAGSATLVINATVGPNTAGKTLTNTATTGTADQDDPISTNNSASASLTVHGADLAVTKTTSRNHPVAGENVVFTITVTNNGPDATTAVVVNDHLSYHLKYNFSSPSQGTYDLDSGDWVVGNLATGASATLTLSTTLLEGATFDNIAKVTASGQPDSNTDNNTAVVPIAGYEKFDAGACVVDMGITTQAAGLKPYGFVYDLVMTKQVPVYWSINPDKAKDGIDFTANAKNYKGGSFIISAEWVPYVQAEITLWRSKGAVIDCNLPEFTAPIYDYISSMPNSVLDRDNGTIAATAFFTPAEIPTTAYKIGGPENLVDCDDVYYMPHADPQAWPAATKTIFHNYILNGGALYAACHSASAIEAAAPTYLGWNFLSTTGLIDWNNHLDQSYVYPYSYDPASANDPLAQHIGNLQGAISGGSEEVYLPVLNGAWRPTTTVAVWDPNQANVLNKTSPGKAALLAYGRAYGNPDYGMIVYQASHTFQAGSIAENTAAARTLGNLLLTTGIENRPQITASIPDYVQAGQTVYLSAEVQGGSPGYNYTWSSTCSGGSFGDASAAYTSYTAPIVSAQTTCIIRLVVEDQCSRTNFKGKAVLVNKAAGLEIEKEVTPQKATAGDLVTYTIHPQYTGTLGLINGVVSDVVPDGMTFVSASAGHTYDDATRTVTWNLGTNTQPVDGLKQVYVADSGTVTLYPLADTWIDLKNPDVNTGDTTTIFINPKAGEISNGLVSFNLSGIPTGATINTAVFGVNVSTAKNNTATIYRMLTPWTETGATWNDSNTASAADWVTGAFSTSDYAPGISYGPITNSSTGWKTLDLKNLVEGWYKGTFANNGMVLLAGGTEAADAKYDTKESANDPYLTVSWSKYAVTLVEISAEPMVLAGDGQVTVTMDVTATYNNSGAIEVSPPATLTLSSGVTATKVAGPIPAGSQTIPMGGGTVTFKYLYDVKTGSSPAQTTFSGTPTSTTVGVSFNPATSNSVIVVPALTLSARVNSPLSVGLTKIVNFAQVCDTNAFASPNCKKDSAPINTFYLGGAIGDRVWLDEDSDGTQDAGETGIANVQVSATWYGPDGVAGGGDDKVYTTVTDSNGAYSFTNLPPGNYSITVNTATLADGLEANPTYDLNGTGTAHTTTLTLAEGQKSDVADFGYNWAATSDVTGNTGTGAIGDSLWIDTDGNGIRDPGELGLGGVTVTLYTDPDGNGVFDTPAATTTTAPDGSYIFDGLAVGAYVVQVTPPTGYTSTGDPDGTFDNKTTAPILLSPGDVYVNVDFGYKPGADMTAAIGDTIWLDANGNGVQDTGEDGLAGITVSLIQDSNGNGIWDAGEPILAATVSDQAGAYAFNGVPVGGDYLVWVNDSSQVLTGMQATYDTNGTLTPNISAVTDLTAAGNYDQTFGYAPTSQVDDNSAINSTIWHDADNDGMLDPGEVGIPGVKVVLTDTKGNTWTTYTDAHGNYNFGDLPAGVYTVTVDPSNFAAGGALYGTSNTYDATGTYNNTSTVTLATNSTVTLTQDFGYYSATTDPLPNLVSSQIFIDADRDGKQDVGETGIAGVVVALTWYGPDGVLGGDDDVVYTTITGSDGTYTFDNLPDGYFEITSNLPVNTENGAILAGYKATDPGVTGTRVFSLDPDSNITSGAIEMNQDLGYSPSTGLTNNAVVASTIWFDADNDGMQDTSEAGIPRVKVVLTNGTNTWTTYTDANGNYVFGDLPSGTYTVTVDASNFDPGGPLYGTTNTYDATGAYNSTSTVMLANDVTVNIMQDFGYYSAVNPLPNSVASVVYTDTDGDGMQDAGETGIAGVVVQLTWYGPDGLPGGSDDVVYSTLTGADGSYTFANLPDGNFSITTDLKINTADSGLLGGLYPTDAGSDRAYTFSLDPSHASGTGVSESNLTMGNSPSMISTATGLIGQSVFLDLDADGTQDLGEGLEGIRVDLYKSDGTTLVMTRYTDETGSYYFGGLEPGTYVVKVNTASLPAGVTNTVDPDMGSDSTSTVTITAENPTNTLQDFGYAAATPNTITGTVWNDSDANGFLNETNAGKAGVTIVLYDSAGKVIATTTTDADGNYSFSGLPDGSYRVDVIDLYNVLDGGWHTLGTPATDGYSQVDPLPVTLSGGTTVSYADFGYYTDPAVAGNLIWYDVDGNGLQDADEPGIAGLPVTLTVTYQGGVTSTLTVVTDANGNYSFKNLLLDENYSQAGAVKPTYSISLGMPADSKYIATPLKKGTDPALDSDLYTGTTALISLGSANDTTDFGFYQADWGDAPDSYSTSKFASGPFHIVYPDTTADGLPDTFSGKPAVWLGNTVDMETDGKPGAAAGLDTDDGIELLNPMGWYEGLNGGEIAVSLSSSFAGANSAWLVMWFDWNEDGDFTDLREMTIDRAVTWTGITGSVNVSFNIPTGGLQGENLLYYRARLFTSSPDLGGMSTSPAVESNLQPMGDPLNDLDANDGYFTGTFSNGEVEDYGTAYSTLPVTLTYFSTAYRDGLLTVDWTTGTEMGNVGFNLYVENKGIRTKLNTDLIESTGFTTFDPQDYHAEFNLSTMDKKSVFYIEDLDNIGRTKLHGPYKLGKVIGNRGSAVLTDWDKIQAENDRISNQQNAANAETVNGALEERSKLIPKNNGGLPSTESIDGGLPNQVPDNRNEIAPKFTEVSRVEKTSKAKPTKTPRVTPTLLPTATPTLQPTPTFEPTVQPTVEPTLPPTEEPTVTDEPTLTEEPLPTDTPEPTLTEEPLPTDTPEPTLTEEPLPTDTPEPTATEEPLPTDTPEPTATAEPLPTETPTPAPGLLVGELLVNKTGIYSVTYEDLLAAGLDLAGQPAADVAITYHGEPQPIRVAGPEVVGAGTVIEFYGQKVDTQYTNTNVYHLWVDARIALRVAEEEIVPDAAAAAEAYYMETTLVDLSKGYDPLSTTGDPWYNTRMLVYKTPKSWNYPITIDSYLAGLAPASLQVVTYGGTDYAGSPDHSVVVSLNSSVVTSGAFSSIETKVLEASLVDGVLLEGANTVTLTLPGDTGKPADVVYLDKYSLTYPRRFAAKAGSLEFNAAGSVFQVENLTQPEVSVYRLLDGVLTRLNGVEVSAVNTTYSARFIGSDQAAKYFVAGTSNLMKPVVRAARPDVDIKSGSADYLIISHPNFISGLTPLVEARVANGLQVRVVDVMDIYNQFSYGVVDPEAIQSYIKHAASSMGTRYVLLVGDDTYDYKGYVYTTSISFIPSIYMAVGDLVKFAPVDPKYADVNNDNVPDLALGRFPVRTLTELSNVITKTLAYDNKDYTRTSIFTADWEYGEESDALLAHLPSDWTIEKAYLDQIGAAAAHNQLIASINKGVALTSFVGHTDDRQWTWDNLFGLNDAALLTNGSKPTLFNQNGCWNNYYINPRYENLTDVMLNKSLTGGAAMLGSTTLTLDLNEQKLGTYFMPLLTQPGKTIGDAMLEAKNAMVLTDPQAMDVLLGWSLLGDPYLKVLP